MTDELDDAQMAKMMKELDALEKEIDASVQTPAPSGKPALKVVEGGADAEADANAEGDAVQGADVDVGAEEKGDDFWGSGQNGASDSSDSMEDTLSQYKAEETQNSIFSQSQSDNQAGEEEMAPNAGSGTDGALTLTLKGEMTLKLQYETGGQTVSVSFQNGTMKVTLADGTEFKMPLARLRAA